MAIETTNNKSSKVIRRLLEYHCPCLSSTDLTSLVSARSSIHTNADELLLLNSHVLLVLKYQLHRMALNDTLQLILYLLETNLFLCKNTENYAMTTSSTTALAEFNRDYLSLMVKVFRGKCAEELDGRLKNLSRRPSSMRGWNSLTEEDIQPCLHQISELMQEPPTLRHSCRLIIREHYKGLSTSSLIAMVSSVQLRDYLFYTPI